MYRFDPRTAWKLAGTLLLALVLLPAWTARAQDDLEEPDVDPLSDISGEMEGVVSELSDLNTGKPTQEIEGTIVAKLDDLIAKLEKECEACRGGGASGANPRRPLADSTVIGGPGGSGDLHAARKVGKNWGELPAKERERIMQSLTDGFPAHYQKLLERYFKGVAEEKPAEETADADDAVVDDGAASEDASADAAADIEPVKKPAKRSARKASATPKESAGGGAGQ